MFISVTRKYVHLRATARCDKKYFGVLNEQRRLEQLANEKNDLSKRITRFCCRQ